ncbi:DUF3830 family protein [Naumannella halotolerans]|uniref:Uncharacterized protein DUF3830 n=1 Tax=Naumannella halotolerans TaxID=993414 RepID=A0A4R7J5J1_9ACTN|nr:DUF3830 family protein [Naumannella halotolerans]TDT32610.1 uncharacterized protein DUF3830 [Naumannella halotolerans]
MNERHLRVGLRERGVSAKVLLLDDEAPRTSAAVWEALPLESQVYHGKYARNEIYALFDAFGDPGSENTTITPIPGDLCWFTFAGDLGNPAYGYDEASAAKQHATVIDLAVFYGRNNLLINGDVGWVPGNVFGSIVEGLSEFAAACQDIWMGGARGETLYLDRWEER